MSCRQAGMRGGVGFTIAVLAAVASCARAGAPEEGCRIVQSSSPLPAGLEESSGVVASRQHPGVLWTHNDSGGDPEVVAIGDEGGIVARISVGGAHAIDWEDLALGPCPGGSCLYVADIGDGGAQREEIGVYSFPEPDPAAPGEVVAEYYPARYPGGPRDAEALFVLPSGEIYLITKGRQGPVELYRFPRNAGAGETVTLELVRSLADGAQPIENQVTGAGASPSGEWVAIRSYKRLRIWRTADLLGGGGAPVLTADLSPLGEVQGEAVALLDNEGVVLTSEGGFPGAAGTLAVLICGLE